MGHATSFRAWPSRRFERAAEGEDDGAAGALEGHGDPDDRAALGPQAVDHRMILGRAAVHPGDVGALEDVEILELDQDAGREAGKVLVEHGLEREAARRA